MRGAHSFPSSKPLTTLSCRRGPHAVHRSICPCLIACRLYTFVHRNLESEQSSLSSPRMEDKPLFAGAVVHVVRWSVDGDLTLLDLVAGKLAKHGARMVMRLPAKDVTHLVFQTRALGTPEEKRSEEDKIRELYRKLEKVSTPPMSNRRDWTQAEGGWKGGGHTWLQHEQL